MYVWYPYISMTHLKCIMLIRSCAHMALPYELSVSIDIRMMRINSGIFLKNGKKLHAIS